MMWTYLKKGIPEAFVCSTRFDDDDYEYELAASCEMSGVPMRRCAAYTCVSRIPVPKSIELSWLDVCLNLVATID